MAAQPSDLVVISRGGVNYKLSLTELLALGGGGGGGGGSQEVFVQQTRPITTGPWIWWQTDTTGRIIDCTVNNGA